ncbi:MAG: hypothetical protein LKG26_06935 [Saccharofermentans sp.]|jgi:hypothetical protein|nr:hypothetical protein [Mageeibacillus sp.]MCI1264373.1 hypothetical protein [Saccharofermentans sp.]MCI1275800.1 hypothetical protein [Saccharofermentans sp.]MCI1769557.1 hypothetical protein [Mageeibacillus sp.]MCI2044354.1 hypothetical protein [Mageeibacillus sp.]
MKRTKEIESLAEKFNLNVSKNAASDVVSGVPVLISMFENSLAASIICSFDYYKQIRGSIGNLRFIYRGKQLFFIIDGKNPIESYSAIKDTISEVIAPSLPEPVCSYCGCPGCDTAVFSGVYYTAAHKICHDRAGASNNDETKSKAGAKLTAFLASLGCSIAIMALLELILAATNSYFGILAILIPLASMSVYMKFDSSNGPARLILPTVASVITGCMIIYTSIGILYSQSRHCGIFESLFERSYIWIDKIFSSDAADITFPTAAFIILGIVMSLAIGGNRYKPECKELERPIER